MKIVVVGAGFVGLTTALGLCAKGHHVACVDIDEGRVACLNAGRVPFYEPGVETMLSEALKAQRFRATVDMADAMAGANVSMICVGTPSTDKGIDLSYVKAAAADIAHHLANAAEYHVVTVKSTVVPGSVDTDVQAVLETSSGLKVGKGFGLAMNPEFLREGSAMSDFMDPDRIVIGVSEEHSATILQTMYEGFDCPIITTSLRNAEMIKYASNALLATLISYANEITTLCENVPGLDEAIVMNGVFEDRRFWCGHSAERLRPGLIGNLRGGIGFGGSCFPKDVKALVRYAQSLGYKAPLLSAVLEVNDHRSLQTVERLNNFLGGSLIGKTIAVIGVAFKPDTDDIRESPALRLIADLVRAGASVVMHDPVVEKAAVEQATGLSLGHALTLKDALTNADGAIIATSWADYKTADWPELTQNMRNPVIMDGRQVVPLSQQGKGFTYLRTGKA